MSPETTPSAGAKRRPSLQSAARFFARPMDTQESVDPGSAPRHVTRSGGSVASVRSNISIERGMGLGTRPDPLDVRHVDVRGQGLGINVERLAQVPGRAIH